MNDTVMDLSQEHAGLVRESFNQIRPVAETFVSDLYERLFEVAPHTRSMFSADLQTQRDKLLVTLTTVVRASRDLAKLDNELRSLGRSHRDYGVSREHYGVLKDVLLWTLDRHLGSNFTPEHHKAWDRFFDAIAARMLAEG